VSVIVLLAAGALVFAAMRYAPQEIEEFSACGAVGDLDPAWTRNEGIHFIRCARDGTGRLLKVAPAGGAPREFALPAKLTAGYGPSEHALGTEGRIALAGAGGGIWLLDASQRAAQRIDDTSGANSPAWSPDGHLLAFGRPLTQPGALWAATDDVVVFDPATGSLETVADQALIREADPTWAPDGRMLAYCTWANNVAVVPRSGGPSEIIFEGGQDPAWSPRRDEIVIESITGELVVVDVSNPSKVTVVMRGQHRVDPAWSPDGNAIVFVRFDRSRAELWVVQRDGSGLRRLTDGGS